MGIETSVKKNKEFNTTIFVFFLNQIVILNIKEVKKIVN